MTTVAIFPESPGAPGTKFRAISRHGQSEGPTAGAALDALKQKLDPAEAGTIVVVQNLRPDSLFTESQQDHLRTLMGAWRSARDSGTALSSEQQAELDALVEAELAAATQRSSAPQGERP